MWNRARSVPGGVHVRMYAAPARRLAARHAESMAAFEKSERESARRHTETMAALKALIERTDRTKA